MNQGVVNFSANYGQSFISNTQPFYIISQPNQVTPNPMFSQFNNYYPAGQPCIMPAVSSFYMPQQIMYQSKEDIQTINYRLHQSNNNMVKLQQSSNLYVNQSRQSSNSSEDESGEMKLGAFKKINNQITTDDLQYQKLETPFQYNQNAQNDQQKNIFTQKRSSGYKLENDYYQNSIDNCNEDGLTYENVSSNKNCRQSQKIHNIINSKDERFILKNQAGYRIESQCKNLKVLDIIQTISQSRQFSTIQNQENEFHKSGEVLNNSYSSIDSTFIQLKVDSRKASNFNQENINIPRNKKELKNIEKHLSKQQKNHIKEEYENLKQNGQNAKQNIQIREIPKNIKEKTREEITKNTKEYNNKCIFNLIEKIRNEMKRENKNEQQLGLTVIDQLNKIYQINSEKIDVSLGNENENTIQKEIAHKQQKVIKQEFNTSNNIESINNLLDQKQLYTNLLTIAPIQYSDFVIQLKEKIQSSGDSFIGKTPSKIYNKEQSLQSNKQIKEASLQIQAQKEKFLSSSSINNQPLSNKNLKIANEPKKPENIIQTMVLCESLMETTQIHKMIYNIINQVKSYTIEDQFSNYLNFKNLPSEGQIPVNLPHLCKNTQSNINTEKNQSFPLINEQTNGSSTASTSSQEKIALPFSTEAIKQQEQQQQSQQQHLQQESQFLQFSAKNLNLFEKFDFSQVRQITQKYRSARQQKQNSTYKANSKYHNMNKLLMYNIMSMFQIENLMNFTLDDSMREHLAQIVKTLKMLSKRSSEKYKFEYFSREHYHILFLKITNSNLEFLSTSEKDRYLHEKCYNIDFSKEINPIDLNYINIMKKLFFQIFMISIQFDKIIDDGTTSKQNLRRQYCQKAISGIKKLSIGEVLVRF